MRPPFVTLVCERLLCFLQSAIRLLFANAIYLHSQKRYICFHKCDIYSLRSYAIEKRRQKNPRKIAGIVFF